MAHIGSVYDFRLFDADLYPQANVTFAAKLRCVRAYQNGRDVWIASLDPELESSECHDSLEPFVYVAMMSRHVGASIDGSDADWEHVYVLRANASDVVDSPYQTTRATPEFWALLKLRDGARAQ